MSTLNYSTPETAAVALLIDSSPIWRRLADDTAEDAIFWPGSPFERLTGLTERIQRRIEDMTNPCYPGGLHDSIIRAYFAKVEWREIAAFHYNRAARNHNRDTIHVSTDPSPYSAEETAIIRQGAEYRAAYRDEFGTHPTPETIGDWDSVAWQESVRQLARTTPGAEETAGGFDLFRDALFGRISA